MLRVFVFLEKGEVAVTFSGNCKNRYLQAALKMWDEALGIAVIQKTNGTAFCWPNSQFFY